MFACIGYMIQWWVVQLAAFGLRLLARLPIWG